MGHFAAGVLIVMAFCVHTNWCASVNTEVADIHFSGGTGALVAKKMLDLWNWVKSQANSDNTFIGRCFGIGKKLRFVMPLIIFILGVVVTMLKFLTIFSLKGLGIGVILLIMNVGGLFGKLALLKADKGVPYQPPQTVHFHVHNKDGHYNVDHSGPSYDGWSDRVSAGLSKTSSLAEKLELLNLYKRLGFNVNSQQLGSDNFR